MLIDVEGERFAISARLGPDGQRMYDYLWLNGPSEPLYGFTVGSTLPSLSDLSPSRLEEIAVDFVRAFFAPEGIGPSDFPEFVASRRKS